MAKKTLKKLSESTRASIEAMKRNYGAYDGDISKAKAKGYLQALVDLEIIDAYERNALLSYITTSK